MPKKQPKDWGYQDGPKVQHSGDHPLGEYAFQTKVYTLRMQGPRALDPDGDVDLHTFWNQTVVPLARDLLPTKELAQLVQGYTHGAVKGFNDMDSETRRQLLQSVISRIGKRLKQGGGDGNSQGQGGDGQGQSQQSQSGQGQSKQQKQSKPEKPKQWSQMTPQERQQLRESIEKGQVGDQKPSDGKGQQIDPRSLPRDLAQKLQQQAQQRAQQQKGQESGAQHGPQGQPQAPGQAGQAAPQAAKPDVGGDDGDSAARQAADTGKPQSPKPESGQGEKASTAPSPAGQAAGDIQSKLDKAKSAERVNTGQQAQGGEKGEKQPVSQVGPGQAEKTNLDKLDDDDWENLINEMTTQNPDNTATGFQSIEEMLKNVGYGGGGATLDLKLPMKTTEERLFHTVQEAFMRLGGEPDASDRTPDGTDIWSAKRIAIARWKPNMLPVAKDDFVKSPEDIYFVLDTSGSVSRYANVIAAMAAGALGMVHLFHGPEAHPTFQILRNTPLKHPREFMGLGREYGKTVDKDRGGKAEKQRDICNSANKKWVDFYAVRKESYNPDYGSQCWDTDLEYWLRHVKPARGSRLIFWGDTMSVGFRDPLRIQRLLRPYKFVWMLPFSTDEYKRHYGHYGSKLPTHEEILRHPAQYSSCEYLKLQAVGLQVIGNAASPEGLRNALRKIR